jgi:hypothetical protein
MSAIAKAGIYWQSQKLSTQGRNSISHAQVLPARTHHRNRDFEKPATDTLHAAVQTVVEFVRVHEPWAVPVVFALACGNHSPSSRRCSRRGRLWSVSA